MRQSRVFLAVIFVLGLALPLAAQPFPPPFTEPATPISLWKDLMDGNAVYKRGTLSYTGIKEARERTGGCPTCTQNPPVTVLSCSDSRVPPELVFGRTVGDLFVVRAAGNVADPFEIASIEYAISKKYTKLIVVMGHEDCGAVVEALKTEDAPTPSLAALVERIRESFIGNPIRTWTGPNRVENGVKANARSAAAYLLAHSTVIRRAVLENRVGLVVAYYKLASGEVEVVQQ
jgi:carbonic anhydrase